MVKVNVTSKKIPITLSIYDIYGGLIRTEKLQGRTEYEGEINLVNSGTGVYTVALQFRDWQLSKQILVVK